MGIRDELDAAEYAAEGTRILEAISSRLAEAGYTAEDVGRLSRLGGHQTGMKLRQEDGTDEVLLVDQFNWKLDPAWITGPEWPVVQQAQPVKVAGRRGKPSANGTRRTVIFPDQQFGYRRLADGELINLHDRDALGAALEVARAARPDAIVNLGDYLDLNEWSSKFLVTPEFVETTQPAIDEGHRHLAEQKAIVDDVRLIEGNHDDRLAIGIATNAKAALRLRQAATTPDDWPVMSLPHLLRLDELDIDYVDGYHAGRTKIAPGAGPLTPLYAMHGELVDVVKTAKQARQSYLMGHIHRRARHAETYEVDGTELVVEVVSPGCLCRIDGAVPSTRSAKTRRRPLTRFENWQQGMAVVDEFDDGTWTIETVDIYRGTALWRGKRYDAAD